MTQTIEQRARELLARQYEGTEYAKVLRKGKSNKYLDGSDIKALAALTEALTRVEELERAIQTHFEALDRHDKSSDGFGKSRETYAEVMGTLHVLRHATLSKGITE